jgi:hypothetical protein
VTLATGVHLERVNPPTPLIAGFPVSLGSAERPHFRATWLTWPTD